MQTNAEIELLKKEKKAIILAHNYQSHEVQDIADFTGDSLELSKIAAASDAEIIVFCGVHFMAESACILSPQKKVILPDKTAGCPMADMVNAEDILEMKTLHPLAAVATYINSSAEVKAVSDVCVTSSNAVDIISKLDEEEIIFIPDRNLAAYVQRFTPKKILPWKGFCPIHEQFTLEELTAMKEKYPNAYVIVHPECTPEIIDMADKAMSTGQMVKNITAVKNKQVIIGTEEGLLYKLKKISPDKEIILASNRLFCPNMKKVTVEKVVHSLIDEGPVITVPEGIRVKAMKALQRMMDYS